MLNLRVITVADCHSNVEPQYSSHSKELRCCERRAAAAMVKSSRLHLISIRCGMTRMRLIKGPQCHISWRIFSYSPYLKKLRNNRLYGQLTSKYM